jgi:hypothetical protein
VRDADPPVRVVLLDLSFTPSWTSRASTCSPRSATSWTGAGWRCGWPGVRAGVGDMLARSGLADAIGRDHLYREVEDAAGDASA